LKDDISCKQRLLGEGKQMRKQESHEPCVGIFWFFRGKLVIDSSTLKEAEPYGDHLTHPRSHIDVWQQFQQVGKVPRESEYEEYPRGRVMHHPASGEFMILADKCILDHKDLIAQIKGALRLPAKTKTGTDPHYKCHHCLYGEGNEDDWED
jgi:hypothetical protein